MKKNIYSAVLIFAIASISISPLIANTSIKTDETNISVSPIATISKFTGNVANGENQLTWETITENNVRQYDIEYSYDNKEFLRGGVLSASDKATYTYNHIITTRPVIFYRLKIVDINGASTYSNVLRLENTFARKEDLIAPTVIRDNMLNITLANEYRNLQVFNSAGVEVYRENVGGRTGNRIGFTLPTLPAGTYFAKLVNSNTSVTKKFMISH